MSSKEFPIFPNDKVGWPYAPAQIELVYDSCISWPKISIVTPSFNQGKYIEETIRSVLLQNYPNLEYIIIDGGSTDNTVEIIKKYESRLNYWVSEPDKGQSHAINKGLEKCTGEIFNWLNSDDWYMPDTFFEIANTFMKDPSLQFVSGFENHKAIDGGITVCKGTFLMQRIEQTIEICEVTQPSTFFKLDAIRKVNGVSEDLHYIMDGEMWIKLLLQYGQNSFLKINKILVNFRLHADSKTVGNSIANNFLFERCSIISDFLRYIDVSDEIVEFYISDIYKSPIIHSLNRRWEINETVISRRKLRIWFIKKYVTEKFKSRDLGNAYKGCKDLIKNKAFDAYLLKALVKLFIKKIC
jgi:glycosyltransferase involved in cell wall biosynthesis